MGDSNLEKKSQDFEHQYLRLEIEANKKMVFERALLIAGTGLAATLLPKEAKGIELLGIPAIVALAFNLWLTVNRLRSNMRIISYIQLFHENIKEFTWIGWENSLRLYRIWEKNCENEFSKAKEMYKNISLYDNLSFYIPIRRLHVAMALAISFFMSFRVWTLSNHSISYTDLSFWLILINSLAFVIFFLWVLKSKYLRPQELLYGIEKNRILWNAVFKSYDDGCLKDTLVKLSQPNDSA